MNIHGHDDRVIKDARQAVARTVCKNLANGNVAVSDEFKFNSEPADFDQVCRLNCGCMSSVTSGNLYTFRAGTYNL